MIELPELLIVIGIFAMMGGYIAFIRHMLAHADGDAKNDSASSRRSKT
jgi:hypothetical protein